MAPTTDFGQFANGSFIAQANHGTARVDFNQFTYEYASPGPPDKERVEAADRLLAEMPLDEVPKEQATLPHGSIMPLSRNPLFVGRDEELKALARSLKAGDTVAIKQVPIAAASGMGGVGKTQLAVEFVHLYGRYFDGGVFWLDFSDPSTIPAEVAATGGSGGLELRPDFDRLPIEDQVRLTMSALQSDLPRLLVFDNCEDQDLLARWQPPTGGSRILVTSRRQSWDQTLKVSTLSLDVLSREESVELLREHLPELPDPEGSNFRAVAEELGDLPLALDLAGRFLARYQHRITLREYLDQLRRPDLLEHRSLREGGISPTCHVQNVYRTFALSLERLDPSDTAAQLARKLLARASRFAPGELMSTELLLETLALPDGDPDAALTAEDALSSLTQLGLLDREGQAVRMHRLVSAFARKAVEDDEADQTVEAALERAAVSILRERDPSQMLALLPHLRDATGAAMAREDDRTLDLCAALTASLLDMGAYEVATRYARSALQLSRNRYGEEHGRVAQSLTNLADALMLQGDYDEARQLYVQALSKCRKVFGDDHTNTAGCHKNVAEVLRHLAKYDEALPHAESALEIYEKASEHEDVRVAHAHSVVSGVCGEMGNLDKSRHHAQRALEIQEAERGADHPDTAQALHNFAIVLQDSGQFAEARSHFEEALGITRTTLGEQHPDVATGLLSVATVLAQMKCLEEARPRAQEALEMRRDILGEEHPLTLHASNVLAPILWQQGEFVEARDLYERALPLSEHRLGEGFPLTDAVVNNYALMLMMQGEVNEAKHLYERALRGRRVFYGEEHPLVADALSTLAGVELAQGNPQEALRLYESALEVSRRSSGEEHPDTDKLLDKLTDLLLQQGAYDQAEQLNERILADRRAKLGGKHPAVAHSQNNMGNVFSEQGKYDEARRAYGKALHIFRTQYGGDHYYTARVLYNLSDALTELGLHKEAEPLREQALTIFEDVDNRE